MKQRIESRNYVSTDRVIGDVLGSGPESFDQKISGGKKHYMGGPAHQSNMKNLLGNTNTDPFNKENKIIN